MSDRIKLRPYQQDAVENAIRMIEERGNSLIVAGTGAGKTIMMAATIGRYFGGFYSNHKKRPHVLVLVHRTEIHDQNHEKFVRVCPEIQTSEITADRKSLHGYIHFGMVQTVVNLLDDFKFAKSFFDLIVIDEAHHAKASTYEKIIQWNREGNPDMALLGVTATPNRGDKLPLIELFDNYYQITTRYLIDSHYLVRPTMIDAAPVFTAEDGSTEKGHLAKNCNLSDMSGKNLISSLLHSYVSLMLPGQSIIFAPSHEFCEAIYDELKFMGRRPAYLSLNIDADTRQQIIDRFKSGEYTELINVDICTEGFDYPELRNLVEFDTNGTHGQWVQKVGRVLRTAPGKTKCTVIDFGGNIDLYPDGVETDVNLEGAVKKKRGEHLTEEDFFSGKKAKKERLTADFDLGEEEEFTPYHPPKGFETVSDAEFGIVLSACCENCDCIIVSDGDRYTAYLTDKNKITRQLSGDFDTVAKEAAVYIGDIGERIEKAISKIQIRMLAPDYATTAMDWYQANCCIAWKVWKEEIRRCLSKNAKSKTSQSP